MKITEAVVKEFDGFIYFSAKRIAFRTKSRRVLIDDLVQEGRLGLYEAAKRYCPEKGSFRTYAPYWILQRMRRLVVVVNQQTRMQVEASPNNEEGVCAWDWVAPDPSPEHVSITSDLVEKLSTVLTERERFVLGRVISEDLYKDVGLQIGVSRQRVDQINIIVNKKLAAFGKALKESELG